MLRQFESPLARVGHRLQELVGTDMTLEVAGVADLPHELTEGCDERVCHTCGSDWTGGQEFVTTVRRSQSGRWAVTSVVLADQND